MREDTVGELEIAQRVAGATAGSVWCEAGDKNRIGDDARGQRCSMAEEEMIDDILDGAGKDTANAIVCGRIGLRLVEGGL